MSARLQRLSEARLYLVCGRMPRAFIEAVLRGGVDVVQLRMKHAEDDQIIAAAEPIAEACAQNGALFIVNDRPDLAVATRADGVHLGQDDAQVRAARAVLGEDQLIGLSTHSPAQVEAAAAVGADYIGVGPVYATPTKPGRPAVGLALVRYAAEHARLPFFAIGGIDPGNAHAVARAGARRVAVVRALVEAADPHARARELRGAIEQEEAAVGAAQS